MNEIEECSIQDGIGVSTASLHGEVVVVAILGGVVGEGVAGGQSEPALLAPVVAPAVPHNPVLTHIRVHPPACH